jgi:hypothetical protein
MYRDGTSAENLDARQTVLFPEEGGSAFSGNLLCFCVHLVFSFFEYGHLYPFVVNDQLRLAELQKPIPSHQVEN